MDSSRLLISSAVPARLVRPSGVVTVNVASGTGLA